MEQNYISSVKTIKWLQILVFALLAGVLTYLFTLMPNFLKPLWEAGLGIRSPFNWNHGIGLCLAALVCYGIFRGTRKTSFLGKRPLKSIVLTFIFLGVYASAGISNSHGINPHLWALLFCLSTLIYDIFEETAWRGFLHDSLGSAAGWLKGIITGILWGVWHLLVFDDFSQFDGLHVFVLMTILVSIVMAYAVKRTNSILVAAAIHALLINKNPTVTIICLSIWLLMILTWERDNFLARKAVALRNSWK